MKPDCLISLCSYGSALFALLAAAFWLWSALMKAPRHIRHVDLGTWSVSRINPVDDLAQLTKALHYQSLLSAIAAFAACIAALLQGVVTFLGK